MTPRPNRRPRRARPLRTLVATLLATLVATLVGPAIPALGQDDIRGWASGGWAFPADPPEFWEQWNGGWSLGGGIGYRVAPEWEIASTFHVQRFPADEAAQVEDLLLQGPGVLVPIVALDGRTITAITLMGEARFHFAQPAARVAPWLGFGWGYFRLDEDDATVTAADPSLDPVVVLGRTEDAFGSSVGLGVAWRWTPRVRLALEATWVIGFTEPTSTQFVPVRLGLVLD